MVYYPFNFPNTQFSFLLDFLKTSSACTTATKSTYVGWAIFARAIKDLGK